MNSIRLNSFAILFSKDGESYFECELSGNRKMQIAMWSFYEFAITTDENLETHSLRFNEWEELTEELLELGYDFEPVLNNYIQQFSDEDIDEFTMFLDEE